MTTRQYKYLVRIAIALTIAWVGWSFYDSQSTDPGIREYMQGNHAFEDRDYEKALAYFNESLDIAPNTAYALNMHATTLLQMGQLDEALAGFNRVIEMEPEFGGVYANRGILFDRRGEYEKALADYETALTLNPDDLAGPHWLTRFMRNQGQMPPLVADRAAYLKEQLTLPSSERVLRVPELDAQQRSYKVD